MIRQSKLLIPTANVAILSVAVIQTAVANRGCFFSVEGLMWLINVVFSRPAVRDVHDREECRAHSVCGPAALRHVSHGAAALPSRQVLVPVNDRLAKDIT